MPHVTRLRRLQQLAGRPFVWLVLALIATAAVYLPGLPGAWMFDDFPNIVDNTSLHATHATLAEFTSAALSSPSSDFKRPLASLSFAVNILISGVDPAPMKLTNIAIHLLNGLLVFLLIRRLIARNPPTPSIRDGQTAALVAAAWLLLPINLTAVLYVVQRMENLANLFVLAALYGYTIGRQHMLVSGKGLVTANVSLLGFTAVGLLAKETAVLTPLYAFLIEMLVFRWKTAPRHDNISSGLRRSKLIGALFVLILAIPAVAGALWIGPALLRPTTWAPRDFTMGTRLLSEARIVLDYLVWTIVPTPSALSFHHDDFQISTGLLSPTSTLWSIVALVALAVLAWWLRRRRPFIALGIAWFFACHTLTGTIIPLELIYEHRNYFSSIGIMLALVVSIRGHDSLDQQNESTVLRRALLGLAIVYWAGLTGYTAYRWSSPLTLAQELAIRAPDSARAQYELGRTYIILSQYSPSSPMIPLAYRQLEHAAKLPGASTLSEQALIFLAARLHQPISPTWWESMEKKLRNRTPSIEDESAVMSLSSCVIKEQCDLPDVRIVALYLAALGHPNPHGRLLAAYGDFAWNHLNDRTLAYRMAKAASDADPTEPVYHSTIVREAIVLGDVATAAEHMSRLDTLNVGGRLDASMASLRSTMDVAKTTSAALARGTSTR
jgi:hypothetical protein